MTIRERPWSDGHDQFPQVGDSRPRPRCGHDRPLRLERMSLESIRSAGFPGECRRAGIETIDQQGESAEVMIVHWAQPRPIELAVLLGLALLVALAFARWFSVAPAVRPWPLFLLRAGALTVLVLILLSPSWVREIQKPGRDPTVIYLIDSLAQYGPGHSREPVRFGATDD